MENCIGIKDGNGRLPLGEDEVGKVLKDCFETLYNISTQEQVPVHMYGYDSAQRGNYFKEETIRRQK